MFFYRRLIEGVKRYRNVLGVVCAAALFLGAAYVAAPSARMVFLAQDAARKIPIHSVETPVKQVALTFNAAWDDADTEAILSILEKNGVKASFFLCGIFVDKNPELLKKILDGSHDIGNHGDKHSHVASLALDGVIREISGVHNKIEKALGVTMNLFRPPYGEYNGTVIDAAASLGYYTVNWDVDSLDWKNISGEDIIERVLNSGKLKDGSIVLFHTDAQYTASVLDVVIRGIKAMGYDIVPLSELLIKGDYYIDHAGRQIAK